MTTDLETAARNALEALLPFVEAASHAEDMATESRRLGMGDLGPDASTGLGIKFRHLQDARLAWADLMTALSIQNETADQAATADRGTPVSGSMSGSDADLIAALRAGDNGAVNKRLWELLDRADDRLSAIRNAVLMEAAAQCFIGPSDEWSDETRSGYIAAADDCQRRIRALMDKEPTP